MISASAQDVKVMKLNKRDSTAGVTVTLFNVRSDGLKWCGELRSGPG